MTDRNRLKMFALPALLVGIALIVGYMSAQDTQPAQAHGPSLEPGLQTVNAGDCATYDGEVFPDFGTQPSDLEASTDAPDSTATTDPTGGVGNYPFELEVCTSVTTPPDCYEVSVNAIADPGTTFPHGGFAFATLCVEVPIDLQEEALREIEQLKDFIVFKCTDLVNRTTVVDLRTGRSVFLWMVSPTLCKGYLNQLEAAEAGIQKAQQFEAEGKLEEAAGIKESKEGLLESLLEKVLAHRCNVQQDDLPPGPKTVSGGGKKVDGKCDLPRASIRIDKELLEIKCKLLRAIDLLRGGDGDPGKFKECGVEVDFLACRPTDDQFNLGFPDCDLQTGVALNDLVSAPPAGTLAVLEPDTVEHTATWESAPTTAAMTLLPGQVTLDLVMMNIAENLGSDDICWSKHIILPDLTEITVVEDHCFENPLPAQGFADCQPNAQPPTAACIALAELVSETVTSEILAPTVIPAGSVKEISIFCPGSSFLGIFFDDGLDVDGDGVDEFSKITEPVLNP